MSVGLGQEGVPWGASLLFRELILHPVTRAFENDSFGMMEEPIQNGAGDGGVVVKDLRPLFVRLVSWPTPS